MHEWVKIMLKEQVKIYVAVYYIIANMVGTNFSFFTVDIALLYFIFCRNGRNRSHGFMYTFICVSVI